MKHTQAQICVLYKGHKRSVCLQRDRIEVTKTDDSSNYILNLMYSYTMSNASVYSYLIKKKVFHNTNPQRYSGVDFVFSK